MESTVARPVVRINGGSPALREAAVVLSSLFVIGSVPALPSALSWLYMRARRQEKDDDPGQRRRRWMAFLAALMAYLWLMFSPAKQRTDLMRSFLWDCYLEYFQVRVVFRSGKPLPGGQFLYAMMPHGLYPFGGAMASVSNMMDMFPGMRFGIADVVFRIPVIRHLCLWIGAVPASKSALQALLQAGSSVGLVPGGISEMMRTANNSEQLVLQDRKGFVQLALEAGVPIVPVYVFGNSSLLTNLTFPGLETLSRWLRMSIVLPFGRFGLLIPRRIPLLYAVGEPITCPGLTGKPTPEQVRDTHTKLIAAVQDLYHFYKDSYGWRDRPLHIS